MRKQRRKRGIKYSALLVELDPLLLRGLRDLAAEREANVSQTIRDAIYTAVYAGFREQAELRTAPEALPEGVSFDSAGEVRTIGGFLYEVDGRCLPLTDEPIRLRRAS